MSPSPEYAVYLVTVRSLAGDTVVSAHGSTEEAQKVARVLCDLNGYGAASVVTLEADDVTPIVAISQGSTVTTWDAA